MRSVEYSYTSIDRVRSRTPCNYTQIRYSSVRGARVAADIAEQKYQNTKIPVHQNTKIKILKCKKYRYFRTVFSDFQTLCLINLTTGIGTNTSTTGILIMK